MELFADYGILGLFLAAFLAATILPFSSELLLGILLSQNFHPGWVLLSATSGNVLGSVVNYLLGLWGSSIILEKWMGISEIQIGSARERFKRYGMFSLLFAWVPVIGDPLTVVAGILKTKFILFLVLVGLGKFLRYVFIAWAVLNI